MTTKQNAPWIVFLFPVAAALLFAGSKHSASPVPESPAPAPGIQYVLGTEKPLKPRDVNIPIAGDTSPDTLGPANTGTGGCSNGQCGGGTCDIGGGSCITGNCPGGACDGSGENTEGIKAPAQAAGVEQVAVQSAVRIRIEHSPAISKGSGTIIGIDKGVATVLTCGHLFTEYEAGDIINVDYYPFDAGNTVRARYLKHTHNPDLGLIEFTAPAGAVLVVSPLVADSFVPPVGLDVFNWGCPNGDRPLLQRSRVTYINRYLGYQNIETHGRPEQGRSGAGLFDTKGRILGVIRASEATLNEGLSVGPKVINDFLKGMAVSGQAIRDKRASAAKAAPATKATIVQHTMQGCGPCFLDKRDVLPQWAKAGWSWSSVEDNPPSGTYPWYEITDADGTKFTVVGRLTTEKFNAAKAKVSQK